MWEYHYIRSDLHQVLMINDKPITGQNVSRPALHAYINERGREGWELISVNDLDRASIVWIFKRRIPTQEGKITLLEALDRVGDFYYRGCKILEAYAVSSHYFILTLQVPLPRGSTIEVLVSGDVFVEP